MKRIDLISAELQGTSAMYLDCCILENPHPFNTPLSSAWNNGWIKAFQTAVKQFAFGVTNDYRP